jgi:EmrB/QacA subfamily drug resistance transporter
MDVSPVQRLFLNVGNRERLLATTIVNVAFETISRSFGTTTGHLSWVLNAYSLVFAAVLIPSGRLADQYGRKRLFLTGLAGFAVFSALCGAAPDTGVLIAARALQGAFAALVVPTSLALVLPEFPPARRHVAIGTWSAMSAAAAATGPTLGALLTEYASWRWIFLVNVPICAAMIGAGIRLLRESREPDAAGVPDPVGTLMVAAVPALLSLAIIEGPSWGWSSPWVVAGFAAGAGLLPVFVWRSAAAARPAVDLALFRVRQFRLVNAATLIFAAAFYGMLLSNTIFLQTAWHYSILRAALGATPAPIVVVAVARPARARVSGRGQLPPAGCGPRGQPVRRPARHGGRRGRGHRLPPDLAHVRGAQPGQRRRPVRAPRPPGPGGSHAVTARKRASRSVTQPAGVRWSGSGRPASLRQRTSPRAWRTCQAMMRSRDSRRPDSRS